MDSISGYQMPVSFPCRSSDLMTTCCLCLLPLADPGRARCAVCQYSGPAVEAAGPPDESLALIAAGRLGEAYEWLEREIGEGRESALYCRRLAWLGLAIEDIRAVEIWCHESLRLDPASPEPHLLLGYALLREARHAEALEELEAALKRPMDGGRRMIASALREQARVHIPEWG